LDQLKTLLAALQNLGELVRLEEIVTRYLAGRSTAGLVALTADDAYASWLDAEAFLIARQIPITFFAVADALTTGQRFWWDRVDDAARRVEYARWRHFEDECGLPLAYRQGQPAQEGLVRPMRQWILAEHAGRWPAAQDQALLKLEGELGHRTHQRSMTEPELRGFLSRTNAELAVHTVSHAALPFLPDHEVISEIRHGYDLLRGRFPNVLPYLAIPFGLFDERTLRLTADAGMMVSLTLAGRQLDRPFAAAQGMPRLCVVREHSPGKLTLKASVVAVLKNRLWDRRATPYPVLPSPTT
jgi:peptidoglycan/xylan/chitin deacetylase (PgdA/CDA1 family)